MRQQLWWAVLRSDPCVYCGRQFKEPRTLEHVVPVSLGGSTTWENLSSACQGCNRKRGNTALLLHLIHLHAETITRGTHAAEVKQRGHYARQRQACHKDCAQGI